MTAWFICAVDGWNDKTRTKDQQVNFLTCWDDATGTSEAKVKKCATEAGIDYDEIATCQSGDKAEALQLAAAKYFEQRFPTHAHDGIFGVPHVFINGKDIGVGNTYEQVLKMLCDAGADAGACK